MKNTNIQDFSLEAQKLCQESLSKLFLTSVPNPLWAVPEITCEMKLVDLTTGGPYKLN